MSLLEVSSDALECFRFGSYDLCLDTLRDVGDFHIAINAQIRSS